MKFEQFSFHFQKLKLKLKRIYSAHKHEAEVLLPVLFIIVFIFLILTPVSFVVNEKNSFNEKYVDKVDWHDWKLIEEENVRTGIGERGKGSFLWFYPEESKNINDTHGYNGYLSDKIALNRSLKDLRPMQCIREKYSFELPSVSVIIIFHNEHLSTLLRTCYSVWNRTPSQLLSEIILVDDASTIEDLGSDLADFLTAYMPIVKLFRLEERSGLIAARVAGAKLASSEILIFLDAHCEVYHNWLPPLLDAMDDYKTVLLPTIDKIDSDTFEYTRQNIPSGFAGRGVFDWNFKYRMIPLLPQTILAPSKPFETPIMAGGLFAINAIFFWELGAYDQGLNTYGGEQFELSFKIWQCGGKMLECACSRVGHIYRYRPISVNLHIKYDFVSTNYKRVAEVWMDEYKEHLYNRQMLIYSKVNAGDISAQKALRERLQCKPFKWFLENVAFDLLKHFPLDEPSFAYGGIKNLGVNLCCDTMSRIQRTPIGLYPCAENISHPHLTQTFSLTLKQDIRVRFEDRCWSKVFSNSVWLVPCIENQQANKLALWKYDMRNKWIINQSNGYCLDVNLENQIILNRCRAKNPNQMWIIGNINLTAFQSTY